MNRFFLLLFIFINVSLFCDDWPIYKNSHYRDGITSENVNVNELKLHWTFNNAFLPRQAWGGGAKWDAYIRLINLRNMRNYDPVYHTVVSNGRLFFSSTGNDTLYCLNVSSGETIWSVQLNGPSRIAPSVYGNKLYLGSDDGFAYCFNVSDGTLIWKYQAVKDKRLVINDGRLISRFPVRTGVLVADGKAYFGGSLLPWQSSFLCCLDSKTGKEIYKKEFPEEQCTMEGSLSNVDGKLVVPQGRIAPKLFNMENGDYLGALPSGKGCYTFITENKTILTGPLERGKAFQEVTADKEGTSVSTFDEGNALLVKDGVVYLLSDHYIEAKERSSNKSKWKLMAEFPYDLILANKTLFVGGKDKIGAIDSKTGKIIWEADVLGKAYGFSVSDGKLFVSTDEGRIYCYSVDGKIPVKNSYKSASTVKKSSLVSSYTFIKKNILDEKIVDNAGNRNGLLEGKLLIQGKGDFQSLVTGEPVSDVVIYSDIKSGFLPKKQLTVSAWVKIDESSEKGGIIGSINDSSSSQEGWMLGFSGNFFNFKYRNENSDKLSTIISNEPFDRGSWYLVTAVYDNGNAKLYINGRLNSFLNSVKGELLYPKSGYYVIGAWRDEDEYLPMKGAIHKVEVHSKELSDESIMALYNPRHMAGLAYSRPKKEATPMVGPFWRFTSRDSAEVIWETKESSPTKLFYGISLIGASVGDDKLRKFHKVTLHGLRRDRVYRYAVTVRTAKGDMISPKLEADTFFNYTLEGDLKNRKISSKWNKNVGRAVNLTKIKRALSIVIGASDIEAAVAVAIKSEGRVVVIEKDRRSVLSAQRILAKKGFSPDRIKIIHVDSYKKLSLPKQFASIVVSTVDNSDFSAKKVLALSKPDGGVVLFATPNNKKIATVLNSLGKNFSKEGGNIYFKQEPLPNTGSWSHSYGNSGNAAYTGESLQGVKATEDMQLQWIGKPGARYQTDRSGRKVPPLAENGILYLQGDNRIIALEQYSGCILWSLETPEINRMNMPRDAGNWFADNSGLYLALLDKTCYFDGKTGIFKRHFDLKESSVGREQQWSYISGPKNYLVGTSSMKGSSYTNYDGGAIQGWYDAVSGSVTNKVLSDNLFVTDRLSGELLWSYENGLIVNSTITVDDGRIIFVESNSKLLKMSKKRQRSWNSMKKSVSVVCLNLKDGTKLWESDVSIGNSTTMLNAAAAEGYYTLSGTGGSKVSITAYDSIKGKKLWSGSNSWAKNNHGGHMSMPVIVDGRVYIRPAYFDLKTGKKLGSDQPVQAGGCSSYVATSETIIFRSGDVCLWDPLDEKKITRWNRLRQDCWLSIIPSDGMILAPEGGGGCSCGHWLETSVGFLPLNSEIGDGVIID